ncbi:unnamed protein product [Peronospora belbahrii]|uniref:Uncharacterized protein n=1 Tax=Peronospora belbahrii TaxID=622444 RepID=A0ABN8CMZ1_9STRA|nr:unnamed protein product [Peronospora belbahrii]
MGFISREEDEMCMYGIHFETPAACDELEEKELQDEIVRIEQFVHTLQQQKDTITIEEVVQQHAGHEEL